MMKLFKHKNIYLDHAGATPIDKKVAKVLALSMEAAKSPFRQDAYIAAARHLRLIGDASLDSAANLRLIGDAAATTGQPIEDTAYWVARLYQGLKNGGETGEATRRLMELGVITGATRTALERLTETGASFADSWSLVEGELRKSSGAMKDLGKTIEGLNSTLPDAEALMQAAFGQGFQGTQKKDLETAIALTTALIPVAEDLGAMLGTVQSVQGAVWRTMKKGAADAALASEGLKNAISGGVIAAFAAATAVGAGFVVFLVEMGVTVLAAAAGNS
jgi:hypothetical protein